MNRAGPSAKPRKLVLCFDGTGNKFGENSNVVRLFRALKKDNLDEQLVYYQAGIGTYNVRQFFTTTFSKIASAVDQAVAYHLKDHIKEGYLYLMQNYRPGDKIFLFGFSRGAYTARALAGMLHMVGILPPQNIQQVDFAFTIYEASDADSNQLYKEFKQTFATPVTVEFVGVWDTVSSVGIIPRQLPCSSSNYSVKTFRHALALDERRARFRPDLWNAPRLRGVEPELDDEPVVKLRGDTPREDWVYEPPERNFTDVKEVWFAGCHADIGGGSHGSKEQTSLSSIALRWMIKECFVTKTGILFDHDHLRSFGLDPEALEDDATKVHTANPANQPSLTVADPVAIPSPAYTQACKILSVHMPGAVVALTHVKDQSDAIAKIFDQLILAPFWWGLEIIPLLHAYQNEDGTWMRRRSRNFGRGRYIPHSNMEIKVHPSVLERMRKDSKYEPSAYNWKLAVESCMVEWVD